MDGSAEFDDCYRRSRERLLVQAYALTGDPAAAVAAVRRAFVAAWQRWDRVGTLPDPEGWVREVALRHARRHRVARAALPGRPDAAAGDDGTAAGSSAARTLAALHALSCSERSVLVRHHLGGASLDEAATETGLTPAAAETELDTAATALAEELGIARTEVPTALAGLARGLQGHTLPRAPRLRRDGARRRWRHAVSGIAATVLLLPVAGTLVTRAPEPAVRDLAGSAVAEASQAATAATGSRAVLTTTEQPGEAALDASRLLSAPQLDRAAPALSWQVGETDDNTSGDGLRFPCQRARFADEQAQAALARTYRTPAGDRPRARAAAVQLVEQSRSTRAARRAFDTTLGWYAGCTELGTHLVRTQQVAGVGDEAVEVRLRSGHQPRATLVITIARTGRLVTTVAVRTLPPHPAPSDRTARTLLAAGVNALCGVEGTGRCAGPPRGRPVAPVPVGEVPAMLTTLDLPAVPGVPRPWVATDPERAVTNVAATRCDQADFSSLQRNATRTFLVPGARLPDSFGLTETVGGFARPGPAREFVSRIAGRMDGCAEDDLATEIETVLRSRGNRQDLLVWSMQQEIDDERTVTYLVAVFRRGRAVGQATFVPAPRATIGRDAFTGVARRALGRLAAMPS